MQTEAQYNYRRSAIDKVKKHWPQPYKVYNGDLYLYDKDKKLYKVFAIDPHLEPYQTGGGTWFYVTQFRVLEKLKDLPFIESIEDAAKQLSTIIQ